jgi:hypothetical protein
MEQRELEHMEMAQVMGRHTRRIRNNGSYDWHESDDWNETDVKRINYQSLDLTDAS